MQETSETTRQIQNTPSLIAAAGSVFLLYNISTVILFVIYLACRERAKRKRDLDRMSVQDLE